MKCVREDPAVLWIVSVFVMTQLLAIGWDLPGSYGWENDGIAPRDFFAGIALNLTPGQGHRYPLFHNLLLGVLCLPILVPAALRAEEWTLPALRDQILTVPTMTGVSIVAKLVGLAMASVSILILARMARRTLSVQAGRWAAIWAATSLSFAYYGRVSNLDGPYLMWTALAMDQLLTVAEKRRRRDYVLFGLLAGVAVATKDQAYAGFVLPVLLYLVVLPLREDRPLGPRPKHYVDTAFGALAGALTLGALGGGLLNPSGFLVRFRELTGPASRDWATYERTPEGVAQNVVDLVLAQEPFHWPWPTVALCWIGVACTLARSGGPGIRSRTYRGLPLCAGLSSVLFFTLIVARSEHRFLLPFGFWLSYYGGAAAAGVMAWAAERGAAARGLTHATLVLLVIGAAAHSMEVHLTQRGDARNQVTEYLATLESGTIVETYGLLVHLPHFDVSDTAPYRLQRVSGRPIAERNPLVGATEIDAPYGDVHERRADVLVIPEFTAREFIPRTLDEGEKVPTVHARRHTDRDAAEFFRAVLAGTLNGYEVAFIAEPTLPSWLAAWGFRPVQVHASVGNRQWILRRVEP